MKRFTSKSGLSMLCLMTFIVLWSLFTCENAFSRKSWQRDFTKITYVQDDNAILFNFEFFDYHFGPLNEKGYLKWCDFYYSEDGLNFTHLMRTQTDNQKLKEWTWIDMRSKKRGVKLEFIDCHGWRNGTIWPENEPKVVLLVHDFILAGLPKIRKTYMNIKWYLNTSHKYIKCIKLVGFWRVKGIYIGDKINENYTLNVRPLVFNKMKDNPSVLKSEINNSVKVTKESDAITVYGAKPGEKIELYTTIGTQVKSIVANDDVVNIKLPKNQIYIVKAGEAGYKIAL